MSEIDGEWERLPRTKHSLIRVVSNTSCGAKDARNLFRNLHLNPRDTFIPRPFRQQLESLMIIVGEAAHNCRQEWMATYSGEFTAAVDSGSATLLDVTPKRSVKKLANGESSPMMELPLAAMRKAGADMIQMRGEKMYVVSRKSLSRSREMLEQERFFETEFASCIIEWFVRVGCLSSAESSALVEYVVTQAQR